VNAKEKAPDLIGRCLEYFAGTTTVLDVVSQWPSVAESAVRVLGANVYDAEPDKHDLVLIFGFTHTQPAENLGRLFRRIANVTAPGGGVAVRTFLRDSGPIPALSAVQMLLTGRGGDTHRLKDYTRWMIDAGFDAPQVDDLGGSSLLLARKSGE